MKRISIIIIAACGLLLAARAADFTIPIYEGKIGIDAGKIYLHPYDDFVKLLCHFDGADASEPTPAETGQTITYGVTAQADTAQKQFGTASLLLDGNSDYVTVPDSDDWNFGSGAFTIDFWVRWAVDLEAGYAYFYAQRDASIDEMGFSVDGNRIFLTSTINSANTVQIKVDPWDPAANTWYHFAYVRIDNGNASTSWRIFVNGISQTLVLNSGDWNGTLPDVTSAVYLGQRGTGAGYLNGWLDEIRVSKGIARWTNNFTPPKHPW